MSLSESPPNIERVEVDPMIVRGFRSESDYVGLALSLVIETGSYIGVTANIIPPRESRRWNRHEAVLIGHLVRLYKLIDAMLDQTCRHRRETMVIFARLAFECVVNAMFLIKNHRPEVVASYVEHSMRHEKRLRDRILTNVAQRGGVVLPIEARMLNSIQACAAKSEVDLDRISPTQNWSGKNLFDKAKEVGLDDAYLGAFAGPSHSVHGNWQDMLEYHLECQSEGYAAEFSWHQPRPQILTALAFWVTYLLEAFFAKIVGPVGDEFAQKLPDLRARVALFDELHEEFLGRRAGQT